MKSYTNYIQGTDSSLTMKQVGLTLEEVNAKINAVSDNSQKQLLWMYSLCLFGKESIGKLNQFATEEVL
ncbi:MAG: hypothetical protein LBU27_05875 [Candidatus Peribacteria bacterium]|nr:hypothetical protein [Candidatus Peribacteria bacterium]